MKRSTFKKILNSSMVCFLLGTLTACGGNEKSDAGNKEVTTKKDNKTYELKVSTTQADSSVIVKGLQEFAKKVDERTDGGVKIRIYPSSQLGSEEDMIDQAIQGMNIAVLSDAARMSDYVPQMGIFNMAYFVDGYDEARQVMETETFEGWKDDLTKHGLRVLTFNFYDGARSFVGHKPATTPADLKGQVVRTPGAAPYIESIKSMEATPYNIAWSEVYNGIQTKSIDGCEVQYTSAVSSHIYEVAKFVNKTEHINLLNCIVASDKWFNKLPEEYKNILIETAQETGYENAQYVISLQDKLEQDLVNNGMTIVEVDKEAFKLAANKAYDVLKFTELREKIYNEIGKNN